MSKPGDGGNGGAEAVLEKRSITVDNDNSRWVIEAVITLASACTVNYLATFNGTEEQAKAVVQIIFGVSRTMHAYHVTTEYRPMMVRCNMGAECAHAPCIDRMTHKWLPTCEHSCLYHPDSKCVCVQDDDGAAAGREGE